MTDKIKIHTEFEQGSLAWLTAKKGVISASNVKHIVGTTETPDWGGYENLLTNSGQIEKELVRLGFPAKIKAEKVDDQIKRLLRVMPDANVKRVIEAENKRKPVTRYVTNDLPSYTCRLIAERVTDFIEENYVSWDMMRGHEDEIYAREKYSEFYEKVHEVGFVTNSKHGFTLGFSPDGLVGEDGAIEVKSRMSKIQVQHVLEYLSVGKVPPGDVMQVQAGLLATERKWIDYIVYSGGLPMAKTRVLPDPEIHEAIIEACLATEKAVTEGMAKYLEFMKPFPMTKYIAPAEGKIEL